MNDWRAGFIPLRPAFLHNIQTGPFYRRFRHSIARDWFRKQYPSGLYCPTVDEEDAQKALREILRWDPDCLMIGGGDGTVHHLLQWDLPENLPLRIIPLGTGNVLGFNLYGRGGLKPALNKDPLLPHQVPLGQWGRHYFVLMAGIGFDGRAVSLLSPTFKNLLGSTGYLVAGAKALLQWKAMDATIRCFNKNDSDKPASETNGELHRVTDWKTKWLVARRFPIYFPPFPLTNGTFVFSSTLCVDLFTGETRLEFLRYLLERAFLPQRPSTRGVSLFAQRVELISPVPGHLDGEPLLSGDSLSMSLKKATFLFSENSLRRWPVPKSANSKDGFPCPETL
ncbi:MAG: diacylglycerol/lipid kinase family protein [Leptospirales bacterium]